MSIDRRVLLVASVAGAALLSSKEEAHADAHLSDENQRNAHDGALFKDMFLEAFGPGNFIAGHHLIYVNNATGIIWEYPSADTFIFDHNAAKLLWGDGYKNVLTLFASEPSETRDRAVAEYYYAKKARKQRGEE